MYRYFSLLLFCVASCNASDKKPEKCRIVIPIGMQLGDKFIEQSSHKIKIDPTCTLPELQSWLSSKYGTGILHFCNYHALMTPYIMSPHVQAALQNGIQTPSGLIMSNFKLILPTEEEAEHAYKAVIPAYEQNKINDLLPPPFENSGETFVFEEPGKNLMFRFILNNSTE